jgi:hypothetical protein
MIDILYLLSILEFYNWIFYNAIENLKTSERDKWNNFRDYIVIRD